MCLFLCVSLFVCVSLHAHTHTHTFTYAWFSNIRGHNADKILDVPSSILKLKIAKKIGLDLVLKGMDLGEKKLKERLQKAGYQNLKITKFLLWISFYSVVCASKTVVEFSSSQTFKVILPR